MIRTIINVGLFFFFTFSLLVIFSYSILLYEKIKKPTFKNLDIEGFLWFGLLIGIFIVIDFFVIKRFIKSLKKG